MQLYYVGQCNRHDPSYNAQNCLVELVIIGGKKQLGLLFCFVKCQIIRRCVGNWCLSGEGLVRVNLGSHIFFGRCIDSFYLFSFLFRSIGVWFGLLWFGIV